MKAISFVSCALMLGVATTALSRSEVRESEGQKADAQQTSAQLAFARMKTLAGKWKGHAAMGPQPGATAPVRVSLRVTSGGAALMHEMVPEGRSDDPSSGDDDPITMLYIDGDRLILTHYCDSGKNGLGWRASSRQTASQWSSTFSTSPAAIGTAICTVRYSLLSMRIITPRTGLICRRRMSLPKRTSTSCAQSKGQGFSMISEFASVLS
jgi:hypothetical protein